MRGASRLVHVGIDRQRPQVAAVDADDRRAGVERALELVGVVHLDERREPERRARREQPRELRVVERADNQQHGVGAERRGLEQLVLGRR